MRPTTGLPTPHLPIDSGRPARRTVRGELFLTHGPRTALGWGGTPVPATERTVGEVPRSPEDLNRDEDHDHTEGARDWWPRPVAIRDRPTRPDGTAARHPRGGLSPAGPCRPARRGSRKG